MARQFDRLAEAHLDFIAKQHVFFTASAASGTRINLSPKGLDGLRVLDEATIVYLDLTGSGNETAAHLREDGRLTVMLCSFGDKPRILRLYGKGRVVSRGSDEYATILADAFAGAETVGARQMVVLDIEVVQTSCGFGVPRYDYQGDRDELITWAESKGEEGLAAYQRQKNRTSVDGRPTGLFDE